MTSKYLDDYLSYRPNDRITPSTFISHALKGNAKSYHSHYLAALMQAIYKGVEDKTIEACTSCRGSTAYRRTQ